MIPRRLLRVWTDTGSVWVMLIFLALLGVVVLTIITLVILDIWIVIEIKRDKEIREKRKW